MPCRSDYLAEPEVVIKEVYVTRDEYHRKVDASHSKEVADLKGQLVTLQTQLVEAKNKANEIINERNKIVKELDNMTWAFCYITNRLFENDLNYLKLLLQNKRVAKEFWEHQQLDMKAGRTFIYVDKDGNFQRFNGNGE